MDVHFLSQPRVVSCRTWWHSSSLLSSWNPNTCSSLSSRKEQVPTTNRELLIPPSCSCSDSSFGASAAIHRAGRLRLYVDDALENIVPYVMPSLPRDGQQARAMELTRSCWGGGQFANSRGARSGQKVCNSLLLTNEQMDHLSTSSSGWAANG